MEIIQKLTNYIDVDELEKLINETYGFKPGYDTGYSVAAANEIGENHTVYYPFSAYEDKLVDNPLEVTLSTSLQEIMVDLFRKGLIPEGRYLIDVSW